MFTRISGLPIAAFLISTPFLGAQTSTPPRPAVQRMEQMAAQLKLTEPQKEKIMPILIEEAPKIQAVKNNTSMPQNQKVVQMLQIRNETNDQIRPILNSGQQKKLDQMRQTERQQVIQELSSGKK
ncbi:MAG: hypothetical protein ACRD3S_08890 [Terracidiphilus sp.]